MGRLSLAAFLFVVLSKACAHEAPFPHREETLSIEEARDLGFDVSIREFEFAGRLLPNGGRSDAGPALDFRLEFPELVNGQRIVGAHTAVQPGAGDACTMLVSEEGPIGDDRRGPWRTRLVVPAECEYATGLGVYGESPGTLLYWVQLGSGE